MSSLSEALQVRLTRVHERISAAARAAGRDPASIRLVAVSKTFGPQDVLAAARAGQAAFGENYVQEAVAKIASLRQLAAGLALEWHFIGPIQSNKTRDIAQYFDWVQSVDRERIAARLSDQRSPDAVPLNVLVQVNVSGEVAKSGAHPGCVLALARRVAALPRLRLRGLMAIPAPETDPLRQRPPFARLRALFDSLRDAGLAVDTLSMGMSDDLEAAVAEGATMVRVGSAIFGPRPPRGGTAQPLIGGSRPCPAGGSR
jgi:pyridoxal phosphate enzyme (YggS family)